MILTEEEAKAKRCQESFPAAEGLSLGGATECVPLPPNAISYNSTGSYAKPTAPLMCIGSACMAWRWVRIIGDDGYTPVDTDKGYCGKAGRP